MARTFCLGADNFRRCLPGVLKRRENCYQGFVMVGDFGVNNRVLGAGEVVAFCER